MPLLCAHMEVPGCFCRLEGHTCGASILGAAGQRGAALLRRLPLAPLLRVAHLVRLAQQLHIHDDDHPACMQKGVP